MSASPVSCGCIVTRLVSDAAEARNPLTKQNVSVTVQRRSQFMGVIILKYCQHEMKFVVIRLGIIPQIMRRNYWPELCGPQMGVSISSMFAVESFSPLQEIRPKLESFPSRL